PPRPPAHLGRAVCARAGQAVCRAAGAVHAAGAAVERVGRAGDAGCHPARARGALGPGRGRRPEPHVLDSVLEHRHRRAQPPREPDRPPRPARRTRGRLHGAGHRAGYRRGGRRRCGVRARVVGRHIHPRRAGHPRRGCAGAAGGARLWRPGAGPRRVAAARRPGPPGAGRAHKVRRPLRHWRAAGLLLDAGLRLWPCGPLGRHGRRPGLHRRRRGRRRPADRLAAAGRQLCAVHHLAPL
ncbi:hypothetical protein IWQ57_005424, partial [Coemansia nantahalensis]